MTTSERGYLEWDLSSSCLPELVGDFSLITPFLSHFTAAEMRPGEKNKTTNRRIRATRPRKRNESKYRT